MFRQWRVLFNSSDWLISVLAATVSMVGSRLGKGGRELARSFRLELNEARAGARMRAWARAGGGGRAV